MEGTLAGKPEVFASNDAPDIFENTIVRNLRAIFPVLLFIATCAQPAGSTAAPVAPAIPGAGADAGLPDFTALVESTGPAVVNISVTGKPQRFPELPGAGPGDPMYEFFRRFTPNPPPGGAGRKTRGIGSGFIISTDGYVLTNAHVVAGASDVTVRLADAKREFKAKVVGADRRTDVALLKVDAGQLPTVKLGSSDKLEVGEWVAAIGSPFGFDNTITAGIVSAKQRTFPDESLVAFIQTDVAVNPGNSGGPLLNLAGEVVGINSMIYSGTGGYMGVSFAIPIEVALDVASQLQATGKVTRGRLGVRIQDVTRELARSFDLDKPAGAVITHVEPGTAAAKAKLQRGDVILRFNGELIDDANELPRLVGSMKPGDAATLEVWRQGASRQVQVQIGDFPSETVAAQSAPPAAAKATNRLGLSVSPLPALEREALGVQFGLVVHSIDPAARAPQLNPGDVIVGIGNEPLDSVEEFNQIVSERRAGESVALLVRRGDAALYIPVKVQG